MSVIYRKFAAYQVDYRRHTRRAFVHQVRWVTNVALVLVADTEPLAANPSRQVNSVLDRLSIVLQVESIIVELSADNWLTEGQLFRHASYPCCTKCAARIASQGVSL